VKVPNLNEKLNFALMGCGRIGQRHAQVLASKDLKFAELVGVCDTNKQKSENLANQFNIRSFQRIETLLDECKVDVLTVCTESGYHARDVLAVAGRVQNIIVEKPMALNTNDAKKMIEVCKKNGTRLFVVKQNRFNLPIVKAKEVFDKGLLGKITLATIRVRWSRNENYYSSDSWRGTWKLDGGVIANQASHHVDILEWFMGPVDSVFAVGINSLAKIEAEDTCAAILKFKSGALGIIEATTATRPIDIEGSFSILGEKGTIEVGGFALNKIKTWNFSQGNDANIIDKADFEENPPDVYGYGHIKFYENVIQSILTETPALVEGEDGLRSLELISAIYDSMEQKTEVYYPFKNKHSKLGIL